MNNAGGYDEGYQSCACFWGKEPASYLRVLTDWEPTFAGWRVLDAGAGEGKNAVFCAQRGARVDAVDISISAIANARFLCDGYSSIRLAVADLRAVVPQDDAYDLAIAYGLLHCLATLDDVARVVRMIQVATRPGGYNVVCSFNSGRHDLELAHPGFRPLLIPHEFVLQLYESWNVLRSEDAVLREIHPHNNVEHEHALTRMVARRRLQ